MVNGVAPWEKLANEGAPFNMSTELGEWGGPIGQGGKWWTEGNIPPLSTLPRRILAEDLRVQESLSHFNDKILQSSKPSKPSSAPKAAIALPKYNANKPVNTVGVSSHSVEQEPG
jgi:hypothetical protein